MSKASKFQMVDPTVGEDVYAHMAQSVNDRMSKAVDDLAEKHSQRNGKVQKETSVDGPTGDAYRQVEALELHKQKMALKKAKENEEKAIQQARESELLNQLQETNLDSDDDYENDDSELKRIREKRLAELKAQHQEKMENLSKGHGQYREITQDEFLPEVISSKNVICHFYHREYMRCKIMDKHLASLAPNHVEAKFLKIDAEKAPFFVGKLQINILPTVVVFKDGVATDRIQGFEGLAHGMVKGKEDEFPTSRLAKALAEAGAIKFTAPRTKFNVHGTSSIRRSCEDDAERDYLSD